LVDGLYKIHYDMTGNRFNQWFWWGFGNCRTRQWIITALYTLLAVYYILYIFSAYVMHTGGATIYNDLRDATQQELLRESTSCGRYGAMSMKSLSEKLQFKKMSRAGGLKSANTSADLAQTVCLTENAWKYYPGSFVLPHHEKSCRDWLYARTRWPHWLRYDLILPYSVAFVQRRGLHQRDLWTKKTWMTNGRQNREQMRDFYTANVDTLGTAISSGACGAAPGKLFNSRVMPASYPYTWIQCYRLLEQQTLANVVTGGEAQMVAVELKSLEAFHLLRPFSVLEPEQCDWIVDFVWGHSSSGDSRATMSADVHSEPALKQTKQAVSAEQRARRSKEETSADALDDFSGSEDRQVADAIGTSESSLETSTDETSVMPGFELVARRRQAYNQNPGQRISCYNYLWQIARSTECRTGYFLLMKASMPRERRKAVL
jgi:hypothetical protein